MLARRFTSWWGGCSGLIGIDFGSRGIKMVQVLEKARCLSVVGAARLEISLAQVADRSQKSEVKGHPSDVTQSGLTSDPRPLTSGMRSDDAAALGSQIRAAFAAGGFTGARCVVSLAREDVCLQSVRLPKMPDSELRQSALWEASQRFGFERGAMEVDFIRTGAMLASGESREEVILIAASHASIQARVEPVLAAGLRPVAIDTAFSALVRTFSRKARREADRTNVRAVVEVGESGSSVLILRGDQIAFCKPIAIGGANFNQAVAEHLQMDVHQAADLRANRIAKQQVTGERCQVSGVQSPDTCHLTPDTSVDPATDRAVYEAVRPLMGDLVKEVTLCLRYYGVTFRGHPPDHIILTGGDGLEPKLGEVMANACKAPVVFDDPSGTLASLLPGIRASLNRTPGPATMWAVAVGLSLRGIKKEASRQQGIKASSESAPVDASMPRSLDTSARRNAA